MLRNLGKSSFFTKIQKFRRLRDKGKTLRDLFDEAGLPYINLVHYERDVKEVVRGIRDQVAREAGDVFEDDANSRKRKNDEEWDKGGAKKANRSVYDDFAEQLARMEETLRKAQEKVGIKNLAYLNVLESPGKL